MTSAGGHRIMIDALAARFGGTAYAVIQLSRYLASADTVESVSVVTRAGSIVDGGLRDQSDVDLVVLPRRRRLELLDRLRWESGRLPDLLEQFQATSCLSIAGILPVRLDVPLVSYLLNPVPFQRGGTANRLRRTLIVRTARCSASVVVPTNAMADLVEPHLGTRPAVVALGVERTSLRPAQRVGSEVLVVADFYPHKRHDLVLEAWLRLPEPRPRLRLVGNPMPDEAWAARVQAAIRSLDLDDQIVIEHDLSLTQLAERYRAARAFLLPSELESFCMPLAEALVSGVPGVVRATPVLRETGGSGCLYVDGDDPEDWTEALRTVVGNDEVHRNLRVEGLAHSERYSFDRMAAGLLNQLGSGARRRTLEQPPMLSLPRRSSLPPWALSAGLWVLLVLVLAASVVARDPQRLQRPAAAQDAAPGEDAVYGKGLSEVVPSPITRLTPWLGNTWRRLAPPDGRANITPRSTRSQYFQLGFVAYSGQQPATVALQTSAGQEMRFSTPGRGRYSVATLGPLRARPSGVQGIALFPSVDGSGRSSILLSPFEARWLAPGEAVLRQDSLRERGPGGIPGQFVRAGSAVTLRITPGVATPVNVEITAASERIPARVEVRIGGRRRSARIANRPGLTRIGPFRAGARVRLRVGGAGGRVLLSALKLRPVSG